MDFHANKARCIAEAVTAALTVAAGTPANVATIGPKSHPGPNGIQGLRQSSAESN
jgi:hypothetical protein